MDPTSPVPLDAAILAVLDLTGAFVFALSGAVLATRGAAAAVGTAFGLRILALWRNWRAPAPRVGQGPNNVQVSR